MKPEKVDVIEKRTPFQGYFRIDEYRLRHAQFAGGMGGEVCREVFERGHAVAMLPYDPARDEVVLIEQFRVGAYAALASEWFDDGASPWLVECVAGIIEKGESPEGVARRESVEEAGREITDLEPALHYLATPGGSSESVFIYIGRVDAEGAGGVHGIRDEGEDIRVFTCSAEAAFAMADDGRICNAMTLVAVMWLRIHRDRLRRKWGFEPPG